jgi:hypothetical protein
LDRSPWSLRGLLIVLNVGPRTVPLSSFPFHFPLACHGLTEAWLGLGSHSWFVLVVRWVCTAGWTLL